MKGEWQSLVFYLGEKINCGGCYELSECTCAGRSGLLLTMRYDPLNQGCDWK